MPGGRIQKKLNVLFFSVLLTILLSLLLTKKVFVLKENVVGSPLT
jgi:hypothetical protein